MTSNATVKSNATGTATATTTIGTTGPVPSTVRAVLTPQLLQQRHNLPPSQLQRTRPQTHPHIQLGGNPFFLPVPVPDQLQPTRYPLSSSGRGFINSSSTARPHVQLPDQTVAVVNPNPVPSRSVMGYPPPSPAPSPRPCGFAPSPSPPLVKESAHPYHYKVRISDGASIYALCRSWLRNGHPEESQPQFGDIVKPLPKPAPASSSDIYSPKRNEANEEEENNMDEKAVESLSSKELLQLHVKRAKRVREQLREERLQRIARYKSRLALLLPPLVEQCKNDPSDIG